MFTYIAFYKDKKIEVKALRSYDAQLLAAKQLKAKKSYEVTVILADNEESEQVIHNPSILD